MDDIRALTIRLPHETFDALERASAQETRSRAGQVLFYLQRSLASDGYLREPTSRNPAVGADGDKRRTQ